MLRYILLLLILFFIIAFVVLFIEILDNNTAGGVLVFIFLGFIGLLFLVAVRINKRFLIKTGAFDKTYKELGSDYVKAWKEK